MITKAYCEQFGDGVGVYEFLDSTGRPVYIGKSVTIRTRLLSHLERAEVDAKERAIIERAAQIRVTTCPSEFHALLLEAKRISEEKPPYNVIWKDDKSPLYIRIPMKDDFPIISLVRKEEEKGVLYFGPFSSTRSVRFLLRSIRAVVPFCMQRRGRRPCFYAGIGLCDPCPGGFVVNKEEARTEYANAKRVYRRQIRRLVAILRGDIAAVTGEIERRMREESKKEHFEEALQLRKRLYVLADLIERRSFDRNEPYAFDPQQELAQLAHEMRRYYPGMGPISRIECYDISTLGQKQSVASMVVFEEGVPDTREYRRFRIKRIESDSDMKMLAEVVERRFKNDWRRPELIVVDGGTPQIRTVRATLAQNGIEIPLIGIAKRPDRLYVGTDGYACIGFASRNKAFRIIQRIRDESHRFAKKYHVELRTRDIMSI